MKQLTLLFLFSPLFAFAQKNDYKLSGEKLTINFTSTNLIRRDTSDTGVITLQFIPTTTAKVEMQSQLIGLQGKLADLTAQKDATILQIKDTNAQIKELQALITKIGN